MTVPHLPRKLDLLIRSAADLRVFCKKATVTGVNLCLPEVCHDRIESEHRETSSTRRIAGIEANETSEGIEAAMFGFPSGHLVSCRSSLANTAPYRVKNVYWLCRCHFWGVSCSLTVHVLIDVSKTVVFDKTITF